MKVQGKIVEAPGIKTVVIPRDEDKFVFRAQPVLEYDEFDKLCPKPEVPVKIHPGGRKEANPTDPAYVRALDQWSQRRGHWMFIKSLEATEGLEWETVKMDEPKTWKNYLEELKDSFSTLEALRIQQIVIDACGLNTELIDEATESFLLAMQSE